MERTEVIAALMGKTSQFSIYYRDIFGDLRHGF